MLFMYLSLYPQHYVKYYSFRVTLRFFIYDAFLLKESYKLRLNKFEMKVYYH